MNATVYRPCVADWLKQVTHARFERRCADLTSQSMLDVLDYLRANGFKICIVSGRGANLMRVWAEVVEGFRQNKVLVLSGGHQQGVHFRSTTAFAKS